jgi:hypothetical protein
MPKRSTVRRHPDLEERLLVGLCAAGIVNRRSQSFLDPLGVDWHRLLQLARQHRVVPLIWRSLTAHPELDPPEFALTALRESYAANALESLRQAAHLVRIIKALAAEGVFAIPLKGVCLAALYYRDLSARHAGDVDILISADRLVRADAVLRDLGLLRVSKETRRVIREPVTASPEFRHHLIYITPDRVLVELHFRLHNNPDVLALDVTEVVAGGSTVRLGDTVLPTMPDALQCVFLSAHGARHEWVRLQWLCDIAVMVDRANPGDVLAWLETARRHGLVNPVVQALILAERLLDLKVPAEVSRAYRSSRRIRYIVRRAERAIFAGSGDEDHERPALDPARRFYRMCMMSSPGYLWYEMRDGIKAFSARFSRPSPMA